MVNGFLGQDFLGPQPNFLAPGNFQPQQIIPQQQAAPQTFLGTLGQALRGENQLFNTGLGIATATGGFGEAIQSGIMGAANLRRQQEQDILNRREQEARIAELGRVSPQETFTPVLGPGGQVVGQRSSLSGRVVTDPRAPRQPGIQIFTEDVAGGDPGRAAAAKGAGETFGRAEGTRLQGIIAGGTEAKNQNIRLRRQRQLLQDVSIQGPGAESVTTLKAFIKGFLKIDPASIGLTDDVGSAEAVRAISNEFALRLRNPESGLGLTGNTSDRDLTFLRSIPPGLGKTKDGNRIIIDFLMKVNDRKIEESGMVSEFRRKFGTLGVDEQGRSIDEVLADFNDANPIFSDDDVASVQAAPPTTDDGTPIVSTQEQFNNLAPGTRYIDADSGQFAVKR